MDYGKKLMRDLKKDLFLEERQLIVADLYYRKNLTQVTIAGMLDVSKETIGKDIKTIRKEYHMKRMEKIQVYLNIMDQQLTAVEREAWGAWERSIGRSRKTVKKTDQEGNLIEKVVTTEKLLGDPRYLTVILSVQDRRIRIFGLDTPTEIIVNTMEGKLSKLIIDGKVTFDMLVMEVGRDQAIIYFNMAGVQVPDIVEGEYEDYKPDDILEVLEIPQVVTETK